MKFRKPEPVPLAFIICATILLTSLGIWQIERLAWKNALIAEIETAQQEPALTTLPDEQKLIAPDSDIAYRNIRLSGRFLPITPFRIVSKPQWAKESGYSLLAPFKLKDGSVVLVNRGWAPSDWKAELPQKHEISGVIRPPRGKRYFSPANFPDKNLWFYEDTSAMEKIAGITLPQMIVEEVGLRKTGEYPAPGDGKISLRNDHLGYVITWFSLAIIGLIMFAAYHRIPEKNA